MRHICFLPFPEFLALLEHVDVDLEYDLLETLHAFSITKVVRFSVDSQGRLDSESSPRFV